MGIQQYPYPYTGGFPAVTPRSNPKRPGTMNLGVVLLVLGALPVIALGGLGLAALVIAAEAAPSVEAAQSLATQFGTSPEQGLTIARIAAGTVLGLGLIFLVASAVAWRGRNWGRVLVTGMTALLAAVVVLGLVGGGSTQGPVTLAVVLGIVALSVGGVVLLYLPRSAEYYKARAAT